MNKEHKYPVYPFIIDISKWLTFDTNHGFANGYVIIDKTHPLFGKSYSDSIKVNEIENIKFNGNFIGLFCASLEDTKEGILSLDVLIDVHCGLTYSRTFNKKQLELLEWINIDTKIQKLFNHVDFNNYWVFGFDTLHFEDNSVDWCKERCIEETIKLANILSTWNY